MYLKYPPRADSLIRAAYDQRVLHKGDNFSVLKLEEERQRLSTLFRNNGYYYFRPEFIIFPCGYLAQTGNGQFAGCPESRSACRCEKTLLYREYFYLSYRI